jgi:hypothetical protein
MPPSSMTFCVAIHPELRALDEELACYGGMARGIMDDVYAIGPAHAVFPALQRFADRLRDATGVEMQQAKYACWSPDYDLVVCPYRQRMQVPIGQRALEDGSVVYGIVIGGVPVGQTLYVEDAMRQIADGIVSYIYTTITQLRDHPHAAWAALVYCCQSRLDYWLRHVPPSMTRTAAMRVDRALVEAAEMLGYDGMLAEPLTRIRFHMPSRMRGCGVRSRVMIAPI